MDSLIRPILLGISGPPEVEVTKWLRVAARERTGSSLPVFGHQNDTGGFSTDWVWASKRNRTPRPIAFRDRQNRLPGEGRFGPRDHDAGSDRQ